VVQPQPGIHDPVFCLSLGQFIHLVSTFRVSGLPAHVLKIVKAFLNCFVTVLHNTVQVYFNGAYFVQLLHKEEA
jgi:hypothetical protein